LKKKEGVEAMKGVGVDDTGVGGGCGGGRGLNHGEKCAGGGRGGWAGMRGGEGRHVGEGDGAGVGGGGVGELYPHVPVLPLPPRGSQSHKHQLGGWGLRVVSLWDRRGWRQGRDSN